MPWGFRGMGSPWISVPTLEAGAVDGRADGSDVMADVASGTAVSPTGAGVDGTNGASGSSTGRFDRVAGDSPCTLPVSSMSTPDSATMRFHDFIISS